METEEKKTLKEWFEEKKELSKWKLMKAVDWCKDHKEGIIVFGPAVIGGMIELIKISTKKQTVKDEKALKERYIYDRSNGHYYETKRKLKSSEWTQIDQRRTNGESLGEILNDMRLLK